jgi:hypothetical protein
VGKSRIEIFKIEKGKREKLKISISYTFIIVEEDKKETRVAEH